MIQVPNTVEYSQRIRATFFSSIEVEIGISNG